MDNVTVNLTDQDTKGYSLGTLKVKDAATNLDIDLAGAGRSMYFGAWDGGALSGTYAGALQIKGNTRAALAANMDNVTVNLTGQDTKGYSLRTFNVKDTITDLDMTLAYGMGKFKAGRMNGATLNAEWLSSFSVKGNKKLGIAGDVLDFSMTLTGQDSKGYSLGTARIAGEVANSLAVISHSLRSFSTGYWAAGSLLAVGVNRGSGGWFDGDETSNGNGASIGTLTIGGYDPSNGGNACGVIADDYGRISIDGDKVDKSELPLIDGDAHIEIV